MRNEFVAPLLHQMRRRKDDRQPAASTPRSVRATHELGHAARLACAWRVGEQAAARQLDASRADAQVLVRPDTADIGLDGDHP
jgi:hypothetical protein